MHVVNVTLNLVAGGNLAWQQRKAESMTITPLHAGSAFVGYRPTTPATVPAGMGDKTPRLYGGEHGVTLGTAVTISGAAASPNAGSYSTPAITFLMTFFNARLGAWLGNPGRAGAQTFDRSAPVQNIRPILDEMFGLTTDVSPYVYLSDGGHFENLALYEMVMRRCRFIVVSDAGADPNATFDDLGNAVRKIRVDLGVPIEFADGVNIFARDKVPEGSRAATGRWAASSTRRWTADPTSRSPTAFCSTSSRQSTAASRATLRSIRERARHFRTSPRAISSSASHSSRAIARWASTSCASWCPNRSPRRIST